MHTQLTNNISDQVESEMNGAMVEIRRSSGCKLFKQIMGQILGKERNMALSDWRRGWEEHKVGQHYQELENQMNAEIDAALTETRKNVGIKILTTLTRDLDNQLIRLSWGALKKSREEKRQRDMEATGQRYAMKVDAEAQHKMAQVQSATGSIESQLQAERAKTRELEAVVQRLTVSLREAGIEIHQGRAGAQIMYNKHALEKIGQVLWQMSQSVVRNAVLSWRLRMMLIPPNKRQLITKYQKTVERSAKEQKPTIEPKKQLPTPQKGANEARRIGMHLKKGWMINRQAPNSYSQTNPKWIINPQAEPGDLTGQSLKGMNAQGNRHHPLVC